MKIAIDASHLTEENRTGTHNYLFNLFKSLAKLDNENTYIAYFREHPSQQFLLDLFGDNKNFSCKVLQKKFLFTQVFLARELLLETPDILLCPWHTMPFFRRKSMKVVSVIHGVEYSWFETPHVFLTLLLADKIIAVSGFTKNDIVKRYKIPSAKIEVIYEGIDKQNYRRSNDQEINKIKQRYDITQDYFFFVGTLEKRKNVENMLRAFSVFAKHQTNGMFVLAGSIPVEQNFLLNLPGELGCADRVRFLGRIPQSDLIPLLSGALSLVFVSYSEGFGLPVLEAMSCGVPVISTIRGAVPEIAQGAALLADPHNVSNIADCMTKIANDTEFRSDLIDNGYTNVNKFDWSFTAEQTLKLFRGFYERT